MLDAVQLARARRIVTDRDRRARAVGEALQVPSTTAAVSADSRTRRSDATERRSWRRGGLEGSRGRLGGGSWRDCRGVS